MKKEEREQIWTKSFVSISITQLLIFTVFYTLLTTLPIYVMVDLNESETRAGLVVTIMLISAIITRPFSSKWIDRIGKKKVLLLGVLAFLLTTVAYIFVESFFALSIVRFIHGMSFGVLTTVTGAIAADIVPESRRGEGMGYFAMSMNLAVVIGPFIGLLLIQYLSFTGLFTVLSVFMVIGLYFAQLVSVKETLAPVMEREQKAFTWSDLFDLRALPVAMISGMVGFSYGSILSFVPIFAEEIGLASLASYFFLIFAIVMIVTRPYLGRAFDEKGPSLVLIPSLIVFGTGLLLLSITKTAVLFMLAAAVIGLGYGTILPGFQTVAVQRAGHQRTSQAMSTFFTLYDIGIALGALIWGMISETFTFGKMYQFSGGFVFFTVLVFILYLRRLPSTKSD